MKPTKLIFPITSLLLAFVMMTGCNKTDETETGFIEFGMEQMSDDMLKSVSDNHYAVHAALVTIIDQSGTKVYDKEPLQFYSFGPKFVTKSLKLNVGKFRLTEFMLIDTAGTVLWATPMEGSRLAEMVNDPLPIEFGVYANSTTQVSPEVVRVSDYPPADFGYANFNVIFVDNFCVNIFFKSNCDYWYYDSLIMWPEDSLDIAQDDSMYYTDPAGIRAPYYPPRLVISSEGKVVAERYLQPGQNHVRVPRGYDTYTFRVFDCGNQLCFRSMFSAPELREFSCSSGGMLEIICGPWYPDVTVTPEDIKQPTIEQGVFGMITEPGYDTIWTEPVNDSSVYEEYTRVPVKTEIFIYKAEPSDTVWYPGPAVDCYVHPDMNIQPLAVVRSNSSGYFQLPLEKGRYAYLVRTPMGFYLDLYMSSRVPGVFEVAVGEVTELNIHIEPCIWF